MSRVSLCRDLVVGTAAIALILLAAPLAAQTNSTFYTAKFACGFVQGNLPNAADTTPNQNQLVYRDVQPGSYSTVVNIMNLTTVSRTANVQGSILVDGLNRASVGPIILAPSAIKKLGCPDIVSQLARSGFPGDGRFVEGYLTFYSYDPSDLDLSVIYTYGLKINAAGIGSSMQVDHLTGRPMFIPPE